MADGYDGIALLILVVIGLVAAMLLAAHLVRPYRSGRIKDQTYESGMPVIGDARGRFNVRFYLVAMLFLLFDVEVVFLWPWAIVFYKAAVDGTPIGPIGAGKGFLLAEMAVFTVFLVVGYFYELRKGVFRWD